MGKGINMILGYIVLSIGLDILLLWARAVLSRFLQTYDSIADAAILDEFKRIARWNMYGALAFLFCGGAGILWGVLLTRQQGLLGTFIVLAITLPSLFISLSTRALEQKARSLPSAAALQTEYRRVAEAWVHKVLPDF